VLRRLRRRPKSNRQKIESRRQVLMQQSECCRDNVWLLHPSMPVMAPAGSPWISAAQQPHLDLPPTLSRSAGRPTSCTERLEIIVGRCCFYSGDTRIHLCTPQVSCVRLDYAAMDRIKEVCQAAPYHLPRDPSLPIQASQSASAEMRLRC
jgi:hypothetical protein